MIVNPASEQAIISTLTRRGYLTTEWWTTVIGAGLSAALGLVGVKGPAAAQAVTILAPILIAASYAGVRTMSKSSLARAVAVTAFPQALAQGAQAQAAVPAVPLAGAVSTQTPAAAVVPQAALAGAQAPSQPVGAVK